MELIVILFGLFFLVSFIMAGLILAFDMIDSVLSNYMGGGSFLNGVHHFALKFQTIFGFAILFVGLLSVVAFALGQATIIDLIKAIIVILASYLLLFPCLNRLIFKHIGLESAMEGLYDGLEPLRPVIGIFFVLMPFLGIVGL